MKLETHDGRLFSLRVERYEFPDEELGPTEGNPADGFQTGRFLVVGLSFQNGDDAWNVSAPLMTTTELERFADWLESIGKGNPSSIGVYFTERDLEVSFDKTSRNLLVHSYRDFRPECKSVDIVTIEFPIDQIDIHKAVESLRAQLKAFPGRPPIHGVM